MPQVSNEILFLVLFFLLLLAQELSFNLCQLLARASSVGYYFAAAFPF